MATTRVFGSDGAVAITGHVAAFHNWGINVTQAVQRSAAYGDTWAFKKGGIKDATGTAGGDLKYDATTHAPNLDALSSTGVAAGALTLTAATGCTYTQAGAATAIVSSGAITHAFEGATPSVLFNLDFNGAVAETWDETA